MSDQLTELDRDLLDMLKEVIFAAVEYAPLNGQQIYETRFALQTVLTKLTKQELQRGEKND